MIPPPCGLASLADAWCAASPEHRRILGLAGLLDRLSPSALAWIGMEWPPPEGYQTLGDLLGSVATGIPWTAAQIDAIGTPADWGAALVLVRRARA